MQALNERVATENPHLIVNQIPHTVQHWFTTVTFCQEGLKSPNLLNTFYFVSFVRPRMWLLRKGCSQIRALSMHKVCYYEVCRPLFRLTGKKKNAGFIRCGICGISSFAPVVNMTFTRDRYLVPSCESIAPGTLLHDSYSHSVWCILVSVKDVQETFIITWKDRDKRFKCVN